MRRDIMKLSYGSVIFVLAMLLAVAVAGCTQSSPSGTAPTSEPTATSTTGGSNVPALDFSKIKAYEYKITSVADDQEMIGYWRMEWDTMPYGSVSNAKYTKFSIITEGADGTSSMIIDTYSDPSTGMGLGGHTKMMMGDQVLYEADIPADETTSTVSSQQNPLLIEATSADFTSKLAGAGTEPLTVEAGTFPCTKYVITAGNFAETFWISNTVPIPVKMTQEQDGKLISSMELVDYQV
jgi:hypothetical protein